MDTTLVLQSLKSQYCLSIPPVSSSIDAPAVSLSFHHRAALKLPDIEKTLIKIDEVTSSREDIEAEEALILRGPQPDKLSLYTDALERLNTSIAFKGSDAETSDSASVCHSLLPIY